MELMFCVVQDSLTNGSSVEKICTGSFSNGRSRFRPVDILPPFAGSEPRSSAEYQTTRKCCLSGKDLPPVRKYSLRGFRHDRLQST